MRLRLSDRRPWRSRRVVALASLLLLSLIPFSAPAPQAWAHALLVSATPDAGTRVARAPAQIELIFSEPLERAFSSISVVDVNGTTRDNRDARVDAADATRMTVSLRALSSGVYTVVWHAVSAVDGHAEDGLYSFSVGGSETAPEAARRTQLDVVNPVEVLARGLRHLGLALLVGGGLLSELLVDPARRPDIRRTLNWVVVMLWPAQLALWGVAAGAAANPSAPWLAPWDPVARRWLIETGPGALWLVEASAVVVFGPLLRWPTRSRFTWLVPALALACVLVEVRIPPDAYGLPALARVSLVASATILVGCLVARAARIRSSIDAIARPGRRRAVLRTSIVASVVVLILATVGVVGASPGTWMALTASEQARALAATTLLAIAAAGVFAWRPAQGWPTTRARQGLVAGLCVLASLSLGLSASAPAPVEPDLTQLAASDGLQARLTILPARVGRNVFELTLMREGQPVSDVADVRLRFRDADAASTRELQLASIGAGRFRGQGGHLATAGAWSIEVVAAGRDPEPVHVFAFAVELRPTTSVASRAMSLNFGLLWIFVTLLASAVYAAWPRRPGVGLVGRGAINVAPGVVSLALLVAMGVPAWAWVMAPRPAATSEPANPVEASSQSISRGRTLFESQCVPCHGATGAGDGAVGRTLNPTPADLRLHAVQGIHTDGALYLWITQGIPGSPMPAFATLLSERDRWDIVNYVRTLALEPVEAP